MIGELGLLAGRTRSATVTATGDLWVLRIRRATFRRLLEREPAIAVHLLENVGRRALGSPGGDGDEMIDETGL